MNRTVRSVAGVILTIVVVGSLFVAPAPGRGPVLGSAAGPVGTIVGGEIGGVIGAVGGANIGEGLASGGWNFLHK